MNTQPEALRLAKILETEAAPSIAVDLEAAAELRRLHALNAELLEALILADAMLSGANMNAGAVEKKVRAAIEKHHARKTS